MHNSLLLGHAEIGRKKYSEKRKKLLDFFSLVRIIISVPKIEDLCNGSTPDSDSVCGGSNPSSSANKKDHPTGWSFLLAENKDRDSNQSKCGADERRRRGLDRAEP